MEGTAHRPYRRAEQLQGAEHGEARCRESPSHGERLAFGVVMRHQPRRNAGARADRDEVDAFQRDATEMVQVRPACEAVLHDHEPTGAELPLESLPDLMVECRPRAARDREGGEQRPIIRHAATSFASRSLSAGATGASGARTGPP